MLRELWVLLEPFLDAPGDLVAKSSALAHRSAHEFQNAVSC